MEVKKNIRKFKQKRFAILCMGTWGSFVGLWRATRDGEVWILEHGRESWEDWNLQNYQSERNNLSLILCQLWVFTSEDRFF